MSHFSRTIKSGTHLFHQRDRSRELYIIQEGTVDVYRKIGTNEVLLARLGKGSVLGEMALIDGKPRSASAKAITECTAIVVDAEKILDRIAGVPSWYLSLVKNASEKIRSAMCRLENTTNEHQIARAAIAFSFLVKQHGSPAKVPPAVSIDLRQSQMRLVQLLGMTHQRIVSLFEFLQRGQLITTEDSTVSIPDMQHFDAYCTFLRHYLKNSFDKMPKLDDDVRRLVSAVIKKGLISMTATNTQSEINGTDLTELMTGISTDPKSIAEKLKELALVRIKKIDSSAKNETPLAGFIFMTDNALWQKWHLYITFEKCVPQA